MPHQFAKSASVAGPWLPKNRDASTAIASSPSRERCRGAHSSSSTKVCSLPRGGPGTTRPSWARWMNVK
jgi:hypothetical protein